jgi:hypothetical protein
MRCALDGPQHDLPRARLLLQTAKGKANFDNTGCVYMTTAQVPLNSYESGNVTRVQQVEKQKHC